MAGTQGFEPRYADPEFFRGPLGSIRSTAWRGKSGKSRAKCATRTQCASRTSFYSDRARIGDRLAALSQLRFRRGYLALTYDRYRLRRFRTQALGSSDAGICVGGNRNGWVRNAERLPLTDRLEVRVLFGEPDVLTSNSMSFRLTDTYRKPLGNGKFCGIGALTERVDSEPMAAPGFSQGHILGLSAEPCSFALTVRHVVRTS